MNTEELIDQIVEHILDTPREELARLVRPLVEHLVRGNHTEDQEL